MIAKESICPRFHGFNRNGSVQAVIFSDRTAKSGLAEFAADPPLLVHDMFNWADPSGSFIQEEEPFVLVGGYKRHQHFFGTLHEPYGIGGSGCYGIFNLAVAPSPGQVNEICHIVLGTGPTVYFSSDLDATKQSAETSATCLPIPISEIVESINRTAKLGPASPEMDALLDKLISCKGTTSDLEKWADTLADDVSHLTD
jgi:hypothetical protein